MLVGGSTCPQVKSLAHSHAEGRMIVGGAKKKKASSAINVLFQYLLHPAR
jgi:hypothetical protein